MGVRLVWVGVRSTDGGVRRELLDSLGLAETGDHAREWDEGPAAIVTASGWTILVDGRGDGLLKLVDSDPSRLRPAGVEFVRLSVEEHVMASEVACFRDGRLLWRLGHEGERGLDHLEVVGDPPHLARIRAEHRPLEDHRSGDPVDAVFEAPIALAALLTSYRHDAPLNHPEPAPYRRLVRVRRPGLLGRLFGRGL